MDSRFFSAASRQQGRRRQPAGPQQAGSQQGRRTAQAAGRLTASMQAARSAHAGSRPRASRQAARSAQAAGARSKQAGSKVSPKINGMPGCELTYFLTVGVKSK